jgi:hypothetical protein
MTTDDPRTSHDLAPVDVDVSAARDLVVARGIRVRRRRRLALAGAGVLALVLGAALVGATTGNESENIATGDRWPLRVVVEPHPCDAPRGSPLDVASEPDWRRHGAYSDVVDVDGCLVRIDVVATRPGPGHCGWGAARVLITGNPFGESYADADGLQYVRDPAGAFGDPALVDGFEDDDELPPSAEPSGYYIGGRSIWVDPTDPSAIWVFTDRATFERWPEGDPPICN